MAINPRLGEAVAVFEALGWVDARLVDAPDLPSGTAEQRKTAVAGLRTGDWGPEGEGWDQGAYVGVNGAMLTLFAIRVGVDGRRAASLLDRIWKKIDTQTIAALTDQREPQFARTFVNRAAAIDEWTYPTVLVALVAKHGLSVPQDARYLRSWLDIVAQLLNGATVDHGTVLPLTGAELFVEHVGAWIAARLPARQIRPVLLDALARGWLDRAEAVRLVLSGLDTAPRPVDQ
ncbi:MAG: hypothetical protein FWD11_07600 [Micrococcales bacterium]|nr:hypothetical protein [Micrococcales bacterium]